LAAGRIVLIVGHVAVEIAGWSKVNLSVEQVSVNELGSALHD
jgi:hypothetical protein